MISVLFSVLLVMTPAFAEDEPEGQINWKPLCSQAKLEHWMQSYGACRDQFNKVLDGSEKKKDFALKMCRCVADGLVQAPSCEDLKKLKQDSKFRAGYTKKLGERCHVQ